MRRTRTAFALVAGVGLLLPAIALGARGRVSLSAPARGQAGSLVVFSGRVRRGAGDVVVIQRQVRRRWNQLVAGHAGARGRFALTVAAPARPRKLVVRAVVSGAHGVVALSGRRTVRVVALPNGAQPVVVSTRTEVMDASIVSSVPAPGQAGVLRFSGGNDVKVGQIIVIGVGPATPYGFLGRATSVSTHHGQTVVSTVPASLLDAIKQGSIDAALTASQPHSARDRAANTPFSCKGSASATFTASASFSASLAFKANWKLFGGLQSASLTANASANESLGANLAAAISCALEKTQLVQFAGPTKTFFVGAVPVVLTSNVTIYVDATASANAAVTGPDFQAGFSAKAGIGWTKTGGFSPIATFTPQMTFTPPKLTANADVAPNLIPTLDVLIYGVAGPEIALKGGLDLAADTTANPWWTLTAPFDLTASLTIPDLNLTSPTLDVYKTSFLLAQAPSRLNLSPKSASIRSGSSQTYTVEGLDTKGKDLGPDTNAKLKISPDGTCTGYTCIPQKPGKHSITATDHNATGYANLTVLGSPDHLTLSPSSATITAGSSQTYTVEGYDIGNDDLGAISGAKLSISPDGSCTGYTCTASTAGAHTVTAAVSNGNGGMATGKATLTVTASRHGVVYVANHDDNSVSAIDSATNAVIATIPLAIGASPDGVAVSPDGDFAYVSDGGTGNVSVIDTSTNAVVTTISVGGEPTGSAITPDGAHLYVANGQAFVSVIDTATKKVVATVPTNFVNGADPRAVTISPDGSLAYVADGYGDDIVVISTATKTAVDDVPLNTLNGFTADVVLSPDGQTAYASYYDVFNEVLGGVATIDNATDGVGTYGFGKGVYTLAISPDGKTLYAAQLGGQVSVLTASPTSVITNIPSCTNGAAVASTPDGSYVYTTGPGDNVTVISTTTDAVVATIPVGTSPDALAITP